MPCAFRKHYERKDSIMKTIDGIYTSAKIFTDTIEDHALAQIRQLCDQKAFRGSKIRVMPDVHPGKIGTIGFTSTFKDTILPNVVGVDMGCGITLAKLKQKQAEFQKLDRVIRDQIPAGTQIRKKPHALGLTAELNKLRCFRHVQEEKAILSIGSLGGGNHFIEIDRDDEGSFYAAIHSGSRRLGQEVTEYYLRTGQKALKKMGENVPYELTYLKEQLLEDYLHDLEIVQKFAQLNRKAILDELVKGMKWKVEWDYSMPHNYAERLKQGGLIRKGAVSAKDGETVAIPINMRDGILLGIGRGNEEWNFSAPHGAGRILKRQEVEKRFTTAQLKKEMKGIYCSCINKDTLDEAPFAYRSLDDILGMIGETVEIQKILKPVYNFKAGGR